MGEMWLDSNRIDENSLLKTHYSLLYTDYSPLIHELSFQRHQNPRISLILYNEINLKKT
jgi:hypothetical protein